MQVKRLVEILASSGVVNRLKLPVAAICYALAFHHAYVVYLYPVFEYAHFDYFPRPLISVLVTYCLIAAPVLGYRSTRAPAAFGAALILVLCYVPAQLIMLFVWQRPLSELLLVQISIAASMAILLHSSAIGAAPTAAAAHVGRRMSMSIAALTAVSIMFLVATYHQHMRLVSFSDVYDLRFASSEVEKSAVGNYLILWLTYCFLPFYFARGIVRRNVLDIAVAALGSLLIYMASGAKVAILMGLIIAGLTMVYGKGKDFLFRLLVVATAVIVVIVAVLPDEGAFFFLKSILLMRVLGTGGWCMAHYYDYFSTHGFTYYTHIRFVDALTGAYPYGDQSLGQLIGLEYTGSDLANFNANFWASDAFAAMGVAGVPIVTLAMCAFFVVLNRFARDFAPRFVMLWLSGFWIAVLNVPLSTAILSCGGLITLLLLALGNARSRWRRVRLVDHSGTLMRVSPAGECSAAPEKP